VEEMGLFAKAKDSKKAAAAKTPERKDSNAKAPVVKGKKEKKTAKQEKAEKEKAEAAKYFENAVEGSPLTKAEVKERIVASKAAELFTIGPTKNGGPEITLRYAYLCQRGYYPEDLYKANQDAFKISTAFEQKPKPQIFFGVFDGHGAEGDLCSYYVRDSVEAELTQQMKKFPGDFERAYQTTFTSLGTKIHSEPFDDTMSGTTTIAAFFRGTNVTIANIGDSRAIIGERKGKKVMAFSLSIDQTPYRPDERERVKACGAQVMSIDQLEGIVPYHEDWGVNLGEETDDSGDPPRLWEPGTSGPGTAFTRSIGDSVAERIGVCPDPEILQKDIVDTDEFIILASDGVWEFLTNQSVCDMVLKFSDPLDGCRAVVAESYRLWLQYDERTDDITMILAFFDREEEDEDETARAKPKVEVDRNSQRRGSASDISVGMATVLAGGENRPVRRGLSKEKKKQMAIMTKAAAEEDLSDWVMVKVPKTDEEIQRIERAVKANFLFQHLNETQSRQVYDVMKRQDVRAGDVIIKQGDEGDWFYVVDAGEFTVYIDQGGQSVEILKYTTTGGNNPCFGELALMYSKPRAATVKADVDGVLWAMDRRSFRAILMKSSSASLTKTLRSVEVLKSLSVGQLQRLQDLLSEETFKEGAAIIRQGDASECLYILAEGRVQVTRREAGGEDKYLMDMGPGTYFGERALLNSEPRAANVIALSTVKVLFISKDAFEEVLGPLQEIIDADRQWREQIAQQKQSLQEAEGLAGVSISDFKIEGVSVTTEPTQYALTTRKGREYTIKATSKTKTVEMGMVERMLAEKELAATLLSLHRIVPIALATHQDDRFLYTVLRTTIVTDVATLLGDTPFEEKTAMFYTAAIALGIEHLQHHDVIYRNVTTDAVVVDANGYPQLTDMRYSVKAEPPPTDFCGYPHYLSPEQVSGQGHGLATDYWDLGIFTYEMITGGANPWLTGDPAKDGEVGVYSRISGYVQGSLAFPEGVSPSKALVNLLNELIHPEPMRRLGARGVGPDELQQAEWFAPINWRELKAGTVIAPHSSQVASLLSKAKNGATPSSDNFSGDNKMFASFSQSLTDLSA